MEERHRGFYVRILVKKYDLEKADLLINCVGHWECNAGICEALCDT